MRQVIAIGNYFAKNLDKIKKMNRTERRHNTHVNKWFTNSCEIARSEYLDLKNK